ncbi:MAG: pilus assembly protein PilM [Oscillospiraceae bacterium]|nr:pilus assembly protein PilM [Oscillospiraceae bacterium]
MISIDITDTQIKLVEATVSGKVSVKKAATRELPHGCIENGRIIDMHIVAGEITDILVTEKISDREAIICINSGMILYREILIPKPKAGTETFVIESIIQNEMNLGDDYNITYSISETVQTEDGEKLKVIAAACPQRMIDIYTQLSRQVGLKTKMVMVSNSCITRLIQRSTTLKSISPLLLLQIDRTFINISLYNNGAVVFSRYTKIDASDYENSADYINLAIFDNVFRTMHLINQNELSGEVKEIHYFGTIGNVNALHATINQLNLKPVEFDCPTDLIRKRTVEDFLSYVNLMGSLLKVDPKSENINLLQTKTKRIKALNMQFGFVAAIVAGVCALLVAGVWIFFDVVMLGQKENQLKTLESQYKTLQFEEMTAYVAKIEMMIQNFNTYSDNVDLAKLLFEFQPKMTEKIAEHIKSELLPGMRIIDEFEVTDYELEVDFYCTDSTQPAKFTENLKAKGYFEEVFFNGYELYESENMNEDASGYKFTLEMKIKGGNIFES